MTSMENLCQPYPVSSHVMNQRICVLLTHVRLNCCMCERRVGSKGEIVFRFRGRDIVTEVSSGCHCLPHLIRGTIRTGLQFFAEQKKEGGKSATLFWELE